VRFLPSANYGDPKIVSGVALLAILAIVTISLGARNFSRAAS
jgi:hypothetical protein